MFGYVMANMPELSPAQRQRYLSAYCGICRAMRQQCPGGARRALSYDMAFLALLLMSLYEPEEQHGSPACRLHPIKPRAWTDNEMIRYGADMNLALAYYSALDDYRDDGSRKGRRDAALFEKALPRIREQYPRQCRAMADCIESLSRLEKEKCPNPDLPAGCFGTLMGEILTFREDLWAPVLRQMGMGLGRYIYLADAAVDYRRDRRKGRYNPFDAMGGGEDHASWEQYLVLAMSRCTDYFERLPLVQDKALLDNILYSGVWVEFRRRERINGRSL